MQTTASNQQYVDRLLNALKGATTIDYTAYQVTLLPHQMQTNRCREARRPHRLLLLHMLSWNQ